MSNTFYNPPLACVPSRLLLLVLPGMLMFLPRQPALVLGHLRSWLVYCLFWPSLLLGALASVSAAPEPKAGTNYNLIFVSLTNTRADHLGLYGYKRNTTPNLDALAKRSVVFRNAFTHASWTLPASVSLFTSLYPFTHGLMNRDDFKPLPAMTPTFVDVLKANGYQTAAFVGDRDYSAKFGHTSRFEFMHDSVNPSVAEDWHTYGVLEQTLPPAREWLRRNKDKKFFLLLQAYDTHCPFAVPKANPMFDPNYKGEIDFTRCYWTFEKTKPIKKRSLSGDYVDVYMLKTRPSDGDNYEVMFYPEDVKHMIALYDGEIFNADAQLGKLLEDLKSLDLEKNTLFVFYADHGDMFGKHGRFMRGGPLRGTFYDDVLHIPFFIYHPGLPAGSIDGLAQVVDIGPTLLDLLGLKSPETFRGKSLKPLMTEHADVNQTVFAGSAFTPSERNPFFQHNSVILSARTREWKLIMERVVLTPGPQDQFELYDLRNDPEELRNVVDAHPAEFQQLKSEILKWLKSIQADKYMPE